MKTPLITILFVLICVLASIGAAQAEPQVQPATEQSHVIDYTKMPPLGVFDLPPAELAAKTKVFQDTPNNDKYLAYSIRMPSNWIKQDMGNGQTGRNLLGDIGRYYGPASIEARSYAVIQSTELGYEVTAKNWFLNYILTRGYMLQGINFISDKRVEGLFVLVEKDVSYVVRAVAEINGSRMILVLYYVPDSRWNEEKAYQSEALKSFKFSSPEDVKVEVTRTYAFLDLLRFDYPGSWRLQAPNILSVESMSAKVINSADDSVLNGQIDVNVISTELDTTLPEEIKKVQKALDERGLVIGTLIEQPKDFKTKDHIYYSRVEMYQANDKNKELVDYEYWIGVLIENRYYYIVTMLTPSRSSDFFTWARNSEAFRTVVGSIRP